MFTLKFKQEALKLDVLCLFGFSVNWSIISTMLVLSDTMYDVIDTKLSIYRFGN